MELIDREKLKSTIRAMVEIPNEVRVKVLGAVSRAKAVDIVHCKDCKYASLTYSGEAKYCKKFETDDALYLPPSFYCAYGERKEG